MEPLGSLIILALTFGGGISFAAAHRWWSRSSARRRLRSWARVADELGLFFDDRLFRASGWVDDRYVLVWTARDAATNVAVILWPPLDLGLDALSSQHWSTNPGRFTSPRMVALFTEPVHRALSDTPARVEVADGYVCLRLWSIASEDELGRMIRAGKEIAARIDEARAEVPPDPKIAVESERWRAWAADHAFSVRQTPFGFTGRRAGLAVQAFVARRRGRYHTVAVAEFKQPLGIGFRARPAHRDDLDPWNLHPIETGDAGFDRTFRVNASERELAAQALNEPARRRVVELSGEWPNVVVDDYGVLIEVEGVAPPAVVERLLDAACSAAELVDFVHPRRRAAYR